MLGPEFVVLQHRGAVPWELVLHSPAYEALPASLHTWLAACLTEGVTSGPREQARRAALVEMLGDLWLPDPDAAAVVLGYNNAAFGERWQSYSVDAAGVLLPQPLASDVLAPLRSLQPGRNDPPTPSYSFPHLTLRGTTEYEDGTLVEHTLLVQLWRRILRHERSPLTLLGEWSPGTGERISLLGLERVKPGQVRTEAKRLLAGLPFFQRVATGRPPGSIAMPDFPERYPHAYAAVQDRLAGTRRPTKRDVADELGLDRSTFNDYLDDFSLRWPPA